MDRYIIYHNEPKLHVARDFFDAKNKSYPGSFDYRVAAMSKKSRGYVRKLTGAHAHEGGNALTMSKAEDEADERTPLLSDPRGNNL
eukprot:COSAG02_NODE_21918_length_770_cov_1.011923_1_plen_86_part_00